MRRLVVIFLLAIPVIPGHAQDTPPQPLPKTAKPTRLAENFWRWDRKPDDATPAWWRLVSDIFKRTYVLNGPPPFARSVAFITGVSNYKDNRFDQLPFVTNDLTELRNTLLDRAGFDTVFELRDGAVKNSRIQHYMLNEFTKDTSTLGSEDRLLFYYSGHGGDQQRRYGYLLFQDATPGYFNGDDVLEVETVYKWADLIVARHLAIILDACSSGLAGAKVSPQDVSRKMSGGGSGLLLTAGTGNQETYSERPDHKEYKSLYTKALLDSLRDGAGSTDATGFITLGEIHEHAKAYVQLYTAAAKLHMSPQAWPLLRPGGTNRNDGSFLFLNPTTKDPQLPKNITSDLHLAKKNSGIDPTTTTVSSPISRTTVSSPVSGTWHELRTMWDIGMQADRDVGLDFVFEEQPPNIIASVINSRLNPPSVLAVGKGTYENRRLSLDLTSCPGSETRFSSVQVTMAPDDGTLRGTANKNFRSEPISLLKRVQSISNQSFSCAQFETMTMSELMGTWRDGKEFITFQEDNGTLRGTITETDPCGQATVTWPLDDLVFTPTRISFTYTRREKAGAWQCPGEDFRRPTVDVTSTVKAAGMIERHGPYKGGLWISDNTSSSGGGHVYRK